MLSEFDLIQKFFTRETPSATLGIGDDCALLRFSPGMQTAISTDMLVSGTHFFSDTDPWQLGYKSLAVNLSDLASMGAKPVAFTLALSLPNSDKQWLQSFSSGLFAIAEEYGCELIGGDTTRGPLTICVTIFGEVPTETAMRRDYAKPGDEIWVSGTLGDAKLALDYLQKEVELDSTTSAFVLSRLQKPTPRIALGLALRTIGRAAIDISDGLIGDLSHILKRSNMGASVKIDALPASNAMQTLPKEEQVRYMLAGGDDYELCFTAPPEKHHDVLEAGKIAQVPVTHIGNIADHGTLRLIDPDGKPLPFSYNSFDHFRNS